MFRHENDTDTTDAERDEDKVGNVLPLVSNIVQHQNDARVFWE